MPNRNGDPVRARQRDRRRRAKHNAMIWALKVFVFRSCAMCGTDVIQGNIARHRWHFDHIDPSTKRGEVLKVLHNHGFRAMLEELPKVQLLCEPCHIRKTKRDNVVRKLASFIYNSEAWCD